MTLLELFKEQVERTPEAVALSFGPHSLTFRELDRRSSRLARSLSARGVGPEMVVGVALPRSPELIASLLAAWKVGAAYLPLDPDYPAERISFMASDSKARVVVCQEEVAHLLCGLDPAPLTLDPSSLSASLEDESGDDLPTRPRPNNAAYIIYTSGSTGRPKGVAIEHRSVVTFLHWAEQVFPPQDRQELFASTSVCFDLSIF
ncbi:MAG: AMP-binding protein, partial [Pyrinomonadaceae bacterium]